MKVKTFVFDKIRDVGNATIYQLICATVDVNELVKILPINILYKTNNNTIIIAKEKNDLLEYVQEKFRDVTHFKAQFQELFPKGSFDETKDNNENIKNNIEALDLKNWVKRFGETIIVGKNVVEEIKTEEGTKYAPTRNFEYDLSSRPIFIDSALEKKLPDTIIHILSPFEFEHLSDTKLYVFVEKERFVILYSNIIDNTLYTESIPEGTFYFQKAKGSFDWDISLPEATGYIVQPKKYFNKDDYIATLSQFKTPKKSATNEELKEEIKSYLKEVKLDIPPSVVMSFVVRDASFEKLNNIESIKAEMGMTECYYDEGIANSHPKSLEKDVFNRKRALISPFKF